MEDVCNVGGGRTLFEKFGPEDWALLQLRCELVLLTMVFKKDVADSDRPGIPIDHVGFYYNRFFNKPLTVGLYNKVALKDLVEMVKETVCIDVDANLLRLALPEDTDPTLELLLRHTEAQRECRQRRLDAGDDTATLQFQPPVLQPGGVRPMVPQAAGYHQQSNYGGKAYGGNRSFQKGGGKVGKGPLMTKAR